MVATHNKSSSSEKTMHDDLRIGSEQLDSFRTVRDKDFPTRADEVKQAQKLARRFLRGQTLQQLTDFSDPGTVGACFVSLLGEDFFILDAQLFDYTYETLWSDVSRSVGVTGLIGFLFSEADNDERRSFLGRSCIVAARLHQRLRKEQIEKDVGDEE